MSEFDVGALVVHWRNRPSRHGNLKAQSIRKYIGILNKFLTWTGNPVVSQMVEQGKLLVPRAPDPDVKILGEDALLRLLHTAEGMSGWEGSVARLLVAVLPNCGLRREEIRLARLIDVDTRDWTLYVVHPKGERAWGKERLAPILPAARQAILDYLDERRIYLRGQLHEALIPLRRFDGTVSYWSDGLFAKLKGRLEWESGVRFHLRTFRSTFAPVAKDHNVSIEAVSRALGHRTTRTTEIYYGRIRTESALAEFEQAFAVREVHFSK